LCFEPFVLNPLSLNPLSLNSLFLNSLFLGGFDEKILFSVFDDLVSEKLDTNSSDSF
ncbi:hypothetical protein HMPREF1405_00706, partial [Helicobacter pylori GAM231Ai]